MSDTLDFLERAVREHQDALKLLPMDTPADAPALRKARGALRESSAEVLFRARNLVTAQTAFDFAGNPHLLDKIVKWMRARHPMGSDLAQIAEEFTGGNLVVAKRVLDALVDLKLVLFVNRARDAYWMLAFDWKDPNEVPVPEGRS